MQLSRRSFLGTAAVFGLSPFPRFLLRAAEGLSSVKSDQVLVVVQLSGGNDGLNTVIPFEVDAYASSRPTLAVHKSDALRLDPRGGAESSGPSLGLHPRMRGLHELYEEGRVGVVVGAGYPNPSRSHFRSMDIWHSARPEVEEPNKGWLGRVCERPECRALHIGAEKLPLALQGEAAVPSLQNLDFLDFLSSASGKKLREQLRALNRGERRADLEAVRRLAVGTLDQVDKVLEIRGQGVPVEYPGSTLAQRLKWAGQLVAGGFPARIYYVSQDGYDTHAQQKDMHANLLGDLSDAVRAFCRHLDHANAARRVTVLVFSEFGRRVRENASLGTDHGCAAPVFVVSGRAKGGIHGKHPSFGDLDDGDLRFTTDFRRVYAALLEDVLEVPAAGVLGLEFEKLDLLQPLVRRV